jgi:hypothetical protein
MMFDPINMPGREPLIRSKASSLGTVKGPDKNEWVPFGVDITV